MKTYRITQQVPSYSKRNGGGTKRIVIEKEIPTLELAVEKAKEMFPKLNNLEKTGSGMSGSFLGLFGRTYIHII